MVTNRIALHSEKPIERSRKTILLVCALLAVFSTSIGCTPEKNGVVFSLQAALEGMEKAQAFAQGLSDYVTEIHYLTAWRDCLQLFDDTIHRLNGSLNAIRSFDFEQQLGGVQAWISAALTNQHTCLDGFHDINENDNNYKNNNISSIGSLMSLQVLTVSNLISNSLALFTNLTISPSAGSNRRLLFYKSDSDLLSGEQRRIMLLQRNADVVVAQDGSGNYRTITEALRAYGTPVQDNETYYVMYIKGGHYCENIVIGSNMKNLMMIGDGMGRTVVMGNRNVPEDLSLFSSATFVVWADDFVAKDMTFANTAGPHKFQAVALLVVGDRAVFYRCGMEGYQDTLFLHSNRQFFRDCHIYGTIDFIFGNSAAVIQNSTILVRRPLRGQANTITAQGRIDPDQNSGISIQACKIMAAPDLAPVQGIVKTYMGRPWRKFSRTLFMQSTLGDLIDPAGYLEWNTTDYALDTLYYGEFMNEGAGADTRSRVKWPGFHVINNATEAQQFTVGIFIRGDSWIRSSGVPFNSTIN